MISFIIAVRNEEKALPRTLASLARYGGPHEIIVADDQSTDGTVAAALRLPEVILVENPGPARLTIAGNRNAGAARARGEYLVFADADSYVLDADHFFSRAEMIFRRDPRLAAITFFNRFTPALETWADRFLLGYFNYATAIVNLLGFGSCAGKLHMIRADAFRRAGGYDPGIVASEDVEFFRRLAHVGRTRSVRALTVFHSGRRQHAIGWPRLIWQWTVNTWMAVLFRKARSSEWKEVR